MSFCTLDLGSRGVEGATVDCCDAFDAVILLLQEGWWCLRQRFDRGFRKKWTPFIAEVLNQYSGGRHARGGRSNGM